MVQHLGSKNPGNSPKKTTLEMFTGKNSSSWRWGGGSHTRCRGLPQKDHCNGLLAKIVGHQKSTAAKTPIAIMEMYTPITLCRLFFTAGYRYSGPYDVPLLSVLNQSHVSSTPWKAQKHQRRLKKLQGALPGQFFQLLKTRNSLEKNNLFQRGEKT